MGRTAHWNGDGEALTFRSHWAMRTVGTCFAQTAESILREPVAPTPRAAGFLNFARG